MTYLLRNVHDIMRREERCSLLAESGGSPGMYEFSATSQLLPILVGTTMRDPSGTDLEVPILGIDKNHDTDTVIPLGGSLEDPGGEGLVAIMIGEKAVDLVTGSLSTICGVKMNQEFGVTEPVTLSSSTLRKRRPPPGSVSDIKRNLLIFRTKSCFSWIFFGQILILPPCFGTPDSSNQKLFLLDFLRSDFNFTPVFWDSRLFEPNSVSLRGSKVR